MKYIIALLLLFTATPALAQNETIAGFTPQTSVAANDLIPFWKTQTGTTSNITSTNFFKNALGPVNNTPIGTAAYTVVQCNGSGDETAFFNAANTAASTNRGAILYRNGCVLDNQWQPSYLGTVNIIGFGATPNDPYTESFSGPEMDYNIPGVLANAPGQTAIDIHGSTNFTLSGVNYFAQNTSSSDQQELTAAIGDSVNTGGGEPPGFNTIQLINSSLGRGNTVIGDPLDGLQNPLKAGGVKAGTITAGGSGYVNGTYSAVPFTGGTGTGAYAGSITVSGGAVTSVSLVGGNGWLGGAAVPGGAYVVNDILSASNTNLGGTGSGFQFTVNTVYSASTSGGNNFFVKALNSNIAYESGAALALNITDSRLWDNTFTGSQALQSTFAADGLEIGANRFEDMSNGINLGGPNGAAGAFHDYINSNYFTVNSYGGGYDLLLGRGSGIGFNANLLDAAAATTGTSNSLELGGYGTLSYINAGNNVWVGQGAGRQYAVHFASGYTTDYVYVQGVVDNTNGFQPVKWDQVPQHFEADFVGPNGFHSEMGRPFGIGTNIPHPITQMAFDLSYNNTSMGLPVGSTASRPASPLAGMLRYNSTTNYPEAYIGTSGWSPLQTNLVSAYPFTTAQTPLTVSTAGDTLLASGQQAYYKFDDGSGSTATDTIAGANGTWQGTLGSQWGTGIINGDAVFDGTDNYITTTYAGITGSTARTYNIWVKTTTSNYVSPVALFLHGGTGGTFAGSLAGIELQGGSHTTVGLTTGGFQFIWYNAANLYNGNWHMVTAVWPASTTIGGVQYYLDGVLLTSIASQFTPTQALGTGTGNMTFGNSSSPFFNGQMDEMGVWNRALSQAEITILYNQGLATQYPYTSVAQTGNIATFQDAASNILDVINPSGNLGIGTSTVLNKIDVYGGVVIGTSYSGTQTAPVNGLLIQGNVGIGTANPVTTLDVNGLPRFDIGTTGVNAVSLGSNSPAIGTTAPYAWIKIVCHDNSGTCYLPEYK